MEKLNLISDLRKADELIGALKLQRDVSQIIVHLDCDAFYAAVEELDQPHLRDVPMAVGKGVLTTCNYHARKFGCRSGMAGFVAMKLCPQLVCLPLNFDKYTAKAQEVREVISEYDPRFESASIDEAYLNITEYCQTHQQSPEEVVSQLRSEIYAKAKITVSAGIAANAKLAKIASNRNKPDGQFRLASDRTAIMAFMRDLPTRKVNGVGRVFERELDAIGKCFLYLSSPTAILSVFVGVKTCGDIYNYRAYLAKLFGDKAFQFLITCYLGLGRTKVQPAEEYERKSVGTESTFHDMSSTTELREKLRHIADELAKDLIRTQFKGRTVVLKIKLHTYEVLTRQMAPPTAVYLADDLYKYSLPMLTRLEKEIPGMTLRLMGIRLTNLVSMNSMKKEGVDFFGVSKTSTRSTPDLSRNASVGGEEWEVWPEAEFEEAARLEKLEDMNDAAALSQEYEEGLPTDANAAFCRHGHMPNSSHARSPAAEDAEKWACPICGRDQAADDRAFNEHIDFCLSKQTIQDVVKETPNDPPSQSEARTTSSEPKKKRGRPTKTGIMSEASRAKKRLFFG